MALYVFRNVFRKLDCLNCSIERLEDYVKMCVYLKTTIFYSESVNSLDYTKLLVQQQVRAQSAQDIIKEQIGVMEKRTSNILLEAVHDLMDEANGEKKGSRHRLELLRNDVFEGTNFRLLLDVLSRSKEFEHYPDCEKIEKKLEDYAIRATWQAAYNATRQDFLWRDASRPLWSWLPKVLIEDTFFLKRCLKFLARDGLEMEDDTGSILAFKNSVEASLEDGLMCGWFTAMYNATNQERKNIVLQVSTMVGILENLCLIFKSLNSNSLSKRSEDGDENLLKPRKQVRIASKETSSRASPASPRNVPALATPSNEQDYLLFRPKNQKPELRRIHSVQEGNDKAKQKFIQNDALHDIRPLKVRFPPAIASNQWYRVLATVRTIQQIVEAELSSLLQGNRWEEYFLLTQTYLTRSAELLQDLINAKIDLETESECSPTLGVIERSVGMAKRAEVEEQLKLLLIKPQEKRERIKPPVKQAAKTVFYKFFNIQPGYWEKEEPSSTPSQYVQRLIDDCLDPVIKGTEKLEVYLQQSVCSIALDATCSAWLNCILNMQIKFSSGGAKQFLVDIESLQNWIGGNPVLLPEARERLRSDEGFLRCRGAANLLLRSKGEKLTVFNPAPGQQQGIESFASELLVSGHEEWLELKTGGDTKGFC